MLDDHWLPQPDLRLTLEDEGQLQDIWERAENSNGTWLESLPVPKWKFLSWLVARHAVLLHGSGDADIRLFEPRTPNDRSADDFSKQTAVFAASDGILPMFYAIFDRRQTGLRYLNAALRFELEPGRLTSMHYFFSVTQEVLNRGPWRDGCVYILPRCGFIQQPPYELDGRLVHEPHWASRAPVRPIAKIRVEPEDFPFLRSVLGHNNKVVDSRAAAKPHGFPWLTP